MQACPNRAPSISLREVLPEAEFLGADDIRVSACSCDSRRLRRGELFAALPGSVHDGLAFLAEATARGCSAVLADRPVAGTKVPVCMVPDAREAFGRICQHLAGNPSRRLRVIGVTGTNGKTTTSCLTARLLTAAGYRVGLVGTLGYWDGLECDDATLTTPPADKLASLLARMVDNGCSHAVIEVSSHALDQSRLAGIELDAACVTNVRRDHLDYHRTIDDYRLTKSKLLEYRSAEGFAVLNADDPTSAAYLTTADGPVLTVAMRSAAEITATMVERYISEQTFLLTAGDETVPVCTKMIGTHHVYNCLSAAAIGLVYGIDLTTIARGLEAVQYIPGRLQRIECGQPFGVFVDFAHTPDALAGCLQSLREVIDGRLICVFGAGGDRDREKRPLMGKAVESAAHLAVITNDNPRTEDPLAIIGDILEGFQRPRRAKVVLDRAEAIAHALSLAEPGDCVLIAGKGHETYQIIGRQKIPSDDYEIAQQWLYENQPAVV